MTELDWSNCPDVESVPDRCGGAWVVKDSRVMVRAFLRTPRMPAPRKLRTCSSFPLSKCAAY
jgi:hypothetical protein